MIDAQRKLIGIGYNFGRGGIGALSISAGGVVGQGIASQDRGDDGIDRNGERVSGSVGISDGVDAGPLGRRWAPA